MAPLRWILLLAGLVFLAVLAIWEMRRSRQARRELSDAPQGGSGVARGEPELGQLPEELAGRDTGRLISVAPPVVQLPPDSDAVEADAIANAEDTTDALNAADAADVAADTVADAAADAIADAAATGTAATGAAEAPGGEAAPPAPAEPADIPPLRVDWPPDGERQIIALRLVAASEQRLSGRSTRQALAACGFVHGRYGIFHQPGADGRALLSCASLSKPGIFDPATMDFQRFSGLSVFAVLPGPVPAAAALDQLLATAVELSQRLQALLQDEQGRVLDEPRIAQLRDSVRPPAATVTDEHGEQPAEPTA
jgi:FtsZ-interacting cell division protein ZipA